MVGWNFYKRVVGKRSRGRSEFSIRGFLGKEIGEAGIFNKRFLGKREGVGWNFQ